MKKFLGIFLLGIVLLGNFWGCVYGIRDLRDNHDIYPENTFDLSKNITDNKTNQTNSNQTTPSETTQTDTTQTSETDQPTAMGITMNQECLLNGQCKFNIYQFLGIRTSIPDNNSPELFVQDILLSATFFIGTVVTLALIISGVMFVFAGATGKDPTKAKFGIKYSIIGLLLVVSSYSIIRIVQYIAKGL